MATAKRRKLSAVTTPEPGSFAYRVTATERNLVELVRNGIPEREWLPASHGMLVRGGSHLVAAPKKTGKSIAMLSHSVRMALEGGRVVIFDRENGENVYGERLGQIMDARQLTESQRTVVAENLRYYAFPRLKRDDADNLVEYVAEEIEADLIILDSQRMFLTDFRLSEKDSDDYSAFVGYVTDPLHRAGVATLILDNTGHEESERGRGSSAKGDLNDVLMFLKERSPVSRSMRGELRLEITDSRHGDTGSWSMLIGGGEFGDWVSAREILKTKVKANPTFEETALAVVEEAAGEYLSQNDVIKAIKERGAGVARAEARQRLQQLAAEHEHVRWHKSRGYRWVV